MDLILRHFEKVHMEAPPPPETYDGFVYGHFGDYENEVRSLATAGKRCLRYFNVLSMPAQGWSDPWFDYVNSTVVPLQIGGRFAYLPSAWEVGGRKLWDWGMFSPHRVRGLAKKVAELADGNGVFLDQFWMEPRDWMMAARTPSGDLAARYSDFPQTKWFRYKANITYFVDMLRTVVSPQPVLVNGDRLAPGPMHLEWPHWYDLAGELTRWHESNHAVLAPLADIAWSVDWALTAWKGSGKWIAFTSQLAGLEEAAYARAHAQRIAP